MRSRSIAITAVIAVLIVVLTIILGVSGLAQGAVQTAGARLAAPAPSEQTPAKKIGRPVEAPTGAETVTSPLSLTATGRVSWILKYGLGDPRGLTEKGYANQLLLEQGISVDAEGGVRVEWPLSGVLSINAHLDNQKAENLQILGIKYSGKDLTGEFSDFTVPGDTNFTGYKRKLKGLKVEWTPGDGERWSVTGVLSRVEGIPQTKVFKGNTSPGEIVYSLYRPEQPWAEQPYLYNIHGLEYYQVDNFVPGFTKLKLDFAASPELGQLLSSYNLGYLLPTITADPQREVEQARYVVVTRNGEQYLLLKRPVLELLRDALKDYIDDYNEANELTGDKRKEYPLSAGTDYELGFLQALIANYVHFELDGTQLRLNGYQQERFYFLGHTQIDPDSVKVEVKTDKGFTSIEDPSLIGYDYFLFPNEGIIELDFPAEFFTDLEGAQVRVSFNYAVSGGMYILGLSIVRGSEKVYLNGKLLQRDVDYTIDYETGALLLFTPVGPSDELKIEYEIFRGGLGGYTEYQRGLSGLLINYKPSEDMAFSLDLLRAADNPTAGVDRSSLRVMPNDHLVAGFGGKLRLQDLEAELELGYNHNRFPFDDNRRRNLPNRINVIRVINYNNREYVLLGHQNGLTVYDGNRWQSYGPTEGLAGRRVRAIAYDEGTRQLVFATGSGISVLKLEGEDPFAMLTNWRRFYKQDGLASQDVFAVLIQDNILYVGTAAGLCRVPLDELDNKDSWVTYNRASFPALPSDRILHLASDGRFIYLGTDAGLVLFDPQKEAFTALPELAGVRINALLSRDDEVLVATDYGVRAISAGHGSGWLPAPAEPVTALAYFDDRLWYGTPSGLYRADQLVKPALQAPVSALGAGLAALWIGPEAGSDYKLSIWRLAPEGKLREFSTRTTLISGRDEFRFTDIPANKHTDQGWAGVLTVTQNLGKKLQLIGQLQSISPRFTTLENESRQDVKSWSLAAKWTPFSRLSLTAKHEADLLNSELGKLEEFARPRYSEKDSLQLGWGPGLTLGYTLERIARRGQGFTEARGDLTVGTKSTFWDGLLGLNLSYERIDYLDLRWGKRSSQEHKLNLDLRMRPLPGLTLDWSYTRPIKVFHYGERTRSWGSEGLGLTVSWAEDFPLFSIDAEYNREGRRRLPPAEGEQETTEEGKLTVKFEQLDLNVSGLTLTLYPRGALSFAHKDTQLRLTGEGSVRGELGQFKANLGYKLNGTLDRRTRRSELVNNISGQLSYTGIKNLKPSLSLQGTVKLLHHPRYGEKTIENWTLSAGLGWTISPELTNNISLSQTRVRNDRENTTSYALHDTATFKPGFLPKLSTSLEAVGSYLVGQRSKKPLDNFKLYLALKGNYKLAGNWGASGLIGYVFNLDHLRHEGSYQSLYLSVQIAMTF